MELSEQTQQDCLSEKLIFLSWENADWFEVMQQLGKEADKLEQVAKAAKEVAQDESEGLVHFATIGKLRDTLKEIEHLW